VLRRPIETTAVTGEEGPSRNERHDAFPQASMRGILLLALLSVTSSYSREIEMALENADEVPDTLQWWLRDGGCWRIRIYALDHDIHAYRVANSLETTLERNPRMDDGNRSSVSAARRLWFLLSCRWRRHL